MTSAQPDSRLTLPKYSKLENERRFLVAELPPLGGVAYRQITDRYIEGTRMRLREVVDSSTGARELKLCKKYSSDDPFSGPIVNVYLSEAECDVLRALPARLLTKRRYQLVHRGLQFGLDVFEGELAGLVLCEVEAESRKAVLAISAPPWAGREVTTDTFFTGGRLSGVNAADLAAKVGAMRSF